jgi:hypothetical protein
MCNNLFEKNIDFLFQDLMRNRELLKHSYLPLYCQA